MSISFPVLAMFRSLFWLCFVPCFGAKTTPAISAGQPPCTPSPRPLATPARASASYPARSAYTPPSEAPRRTPCTPAETIRERSNRTAYIGRSCRERSGKTVEDVRGDMALKDRASEAGGAKPLLVYHLLLNPMAMMAPKTTAMAPIRMATFAVSSESSESVFWTGMYGG